jgi:hypothetical protein
MLFLVCKRAIATIAALDLSHPQKNASGMKSVITKHHHTTVSITPMLFMIHIMNGTMVIKGMLPTHVLSNAAFVSTKQADWGY